MTKNRRLNIMIAIIVALMTFVLLTQAFNSMNMATSSKHSYDIAKQNNNTYSYESLGKYREHRNKSIIYFIISGFGAIVVGYNIHYVIKHKKEKE